MIAIPMSILGILLLAYGGRNPTTALFVMTFFLIGTILMFIVYEILPNITPNWTVWLVIYFSFGNAAILGFYATLSPKIGVTLCGGTFGVLFGKIITLTLTRRFVEKHVWADTAIICTFFIIFAILSIPIYDFAVIITSSTFGSYLAWRGLALLLGGYPSERMIGLAIETH